MPLYRCKLENRHCRWGNGYRFVPSLTFHELIQLRISLAIMSQGTCSTQHRSSDAMSHCDTYRSKSRPGARLETTKRNSLEASADLLMRLRFQQGMPKRYDSLKRDCHQAVFCLNSSCKSLVGLEIARLKIHELPE